MRIPVLFKSLHQPDTHRAGCVKRVKIIKMDKLFYLLTLFMLQSSNVIGEEAVKVNCDPTKCPSVPKHYEELGCEAVKSSADDCCVRR
jgi:hypothetical protein